MKPVSRSAAGIVAGTVGGILFLVFLFLLDLGIPLSVAVGIAGYAGGFLVLSPGKRQMIATDTDPETVQEALVKGRKDLDMLKGLAKHIRSPVVRKEVEDIADVVAKIVSDIVDDPKDFKRARRFLGYYLDSTVTVINKYLELAERGVKSTELEASLRRVESSLGTIRQAFERQLASLVEDDRMNLDTELELLERTLDSEGLGPELHEKGEQNG